MQGVIASFGESSKMGAVYGRLAFFELSGGMLGNLAFAWVFDLGSKFGGPLKWGLGAPFWTSAVCCSPL
jgi:hypothetical protein